MKKYVIAILVALAFSWVSGVSAKEESPESMMTCGGGNGGSISVLSIPETINGEGCPPFMEGACASCIISLEDQGCKLVDVIVTHFRPPESVTVSGTTYLLSCVKP